ncbi:MAG TPA: zinc ribbon domain-containing protein [Candidatus Krumholzibacteria bacterium]|nr:zinc ribbon domain-containing protein [Candidatus Krumholzibacteria bacterium]
MKRCNHCGRENTDDARLCQECDAEFSQASTTGDADPVGELERIATLDTEIQAGLVDAILSERKIPHIMQTYHDTAYDGLFQFQQGWGVVLAPAEFRDEIMAVIDDIKQQSSSSTPTESDAEEDDE